MTIKDWEKMAQEFSKPYTDRDINFAHIYGAFMFGARTMMEAAAKVSTDHAMENGPSHDFNIGGHKIAKKIKNLMGEDKEK